MKIGNIVTTSFISSLVLSMVGAYLKITHSEGAGTWLTTGIIAAILFMVSAIYEVRTSERIDHREKTMWTIAFLFFYSIAGLIYFFIGRKRIAPNA